MSVADILASLPPGTNRVYVQEKDGKRRYKPVGELTDDDQVMRRPSDDAPIVWMTDGGRPPDQVQAPATDTGAAYAQQAADHLRKDGIVSMLRRDSNDPRILAQLAQEMGQDIARLDFVRSQLKPERTEQIIDVTVRRIRALHTLHESMARRFEHLQGAAALDPRDPAVKEVVRATLECVRDSMSRAGMKNEESASIFAVIGRALADPNWENQLRTRMQKAARGE